jgi:two-component system sensor histidine kinase KdpD
MLQDLADRLVKQPDRGLRGIAESLFMVAAATLAGLLIAPRWGNSAVDLLYLPAVIGAGVFAGLGAGLVAAVTSTLAFNFFFTAPYHTFRIHSPADLLTVIVLFAVAVVTSQLAASIRRQAQLASAHAARNATIAGFAGRLLSCSSLQEIADVATRELSAVFQCNAVLVRGSPEPRAIAAFPTSANLTPSDLGTAGLVLATGVAHGRGIDRVTTVEWQLHPISSGDNVLAVAGLSRDDGVPAVAADRIDLLRSLLDQAALAMERARLDQESREFAALRERDRIRTTLLATIGEELKPRLAAIGGAAAELRRTGAADKSVVSSIATEASKLQRYLATLLEFGTEPDQRPVEIAGISVDLLHRAVSKDGKEVHLTPKEYAVLAELAKHPGRVLTHSHLLKVAWGPAQENQTEYLRVAIRALRQKLERDPSRPRIILNEPAVGYRLSAG